MINLPLRRLALAAMVFCSPLAAQAQVSLTGGTYSQNFDSLAMTGTSTSLPAGWLMNETGASANATYTAGTGSGNTGDTYSFGAAGSTDRALGSLRSGNLVPSFGACFSNNTGTALSSFDVAYTGEQWRLGTAGRTDQLDFQYSLNATSLTTGTWTDVNALDFVTPTTTTVGAKDGNDASNRTPRSATVSSVSIPNGSTFCLRWVDADATGADDGLAIDDFSITVSGTPMPTLSINNVTQDEGNSGTSLFTFTISLSSPAPAGGVSVSWATSNDKATAPSDFAAAAGTANIAAGQTSTTVSVVVNGDTDLEINETFLVTLSNPVGANIAAGAGVGTGTTLSQSGTGGTASTGQTAKPTGGTISSSNKADTEKDPSAVSPVATEETEDNPFTPDGSATVVDNASDEQGKEFYTIMTPDENVFYLIIDKQRDSENVYFLNAVTESDLMALAQKDTDSQTVTPTAPSEPEPAAPAEPEEPSEPETSEPEPEQPAPKSNNSMMFLVIVAALAAGGLGYYFKVYKPKHDLDDAEDIDDFEFEGPEEPTVNEDEEATGEDAGQEELSEEEEAEQRRLYEEDNEDIPIEGDDDLVF